MRKKFSKFLNYSGIILLSFLFSASPFLMAEELETDLPENLEETEIIPDDAYEAAMNFVRAMTIIKNSYVDQKKTTYDYLFQAALRGMLQELDPFSSYETTERMRDFTGEGAIGGIGVSIAQNNQVLEIISVMPDSPSAKNGLKAGDIILEIDGKPTAKMDMPEVIEMIRGEVNTEVELKIYSPSTDKTRQVLLKRIFLQASTITGVQMVGDGIGYLRMTQFNRGTTEDMDRAIEKLKKEGLKALIIDVRGNPGGLLTTAVEVCSRFIKTGEMIASIEGREPQNTVRYVSVNGPKNLDIPLAILINRNSASASEILAGCMQDHKRAVLIGEKTYGKGSVQTIIPFNQNGFLRITTAKYYTPSRKVIHGNGVTPDIAVVLSPAHTSALAQQMTFHPGELKPNVPNPVPDPQLERAVEILKSLMIFQESKVP